MDRPDFSRAARGHRNRPLEKWRYGVVDLGNQTANQAPWPCNCNCMMIGLSLFQRNVANTALDGVRIIMLERCAVGGGVK